MIKINNRPTANQVFQTILVTLLIIAFLVAVIKMGMNYFDNYKIAEQSKNVQSKGIDLSQAKVWKDKYDQEHIKLERTKVDKAVLESQMDSLAHLLKVKPKQIQSVIYVKSEMQLEKPLTITNVVDTVKKAEYTQFQYKDKWIDIVGDVNKTNIIKISGSDTLTKTDYWKRKWFLGTKHYYSDISNKNPYIKTSGVKQVESDIKDTHFSVGPYIGIGYPAGDFSHAQLSIGISLQYNVIKF